MSDFMTPEIISAFEAELEKIAAVKRRSEKYIRSKQSARRARGGPSYNASSGRVYGFSTGRFRGPKPSSGVASPYFPKTKRLFKSIGRGGKAVGSVGLKGLKGLAKGIGGAAVLASLGIIGGISGSPSPKHYRYR